MLPDQVSNPGPLTYESGALPIALRGPAITLVNQLSITAIKYAYLQVMRTITGKFHQNPLKTVGGVVETRLCLWTDRLTDGRTNHYYSPLRFTSGDNEQLFPKQVVIQLPKFKTAVTSILARFCIKLQTKTKQEA